MNRIQRIAIPASALVLAVHLLVLPTLISTARAQGQLWLRQFGSFYDEQASALAPDGAGGVFVAGDTYSTLGATWAGRSDVYVARYDVSGNQLWLRQFGTNSYDEAYALAPDDKGGVYVAGVSMNNVGGPDVFLARYDGLGNQLWYRLFGVRGWDNAYALSPDGVGGVMIAGYTDGALGGTSMGDRDAYVARYDSNGNRLWIRQFGTSAYDHARALAPDGAGGVIVAGVTGGDLGAGEGNAFLVHFDSAGNQVWARQFGKSNRDQPYALASDGAGGVMVSGVTGEAPSPPPYADAFLARFDKDGIELWYKQFGTIAPERADALAPDGMGGVMVAGWTEGSLGGPYMGEWDAFLAHFDKDGNQIWLKQLGTDGRDLAKAVAIGNAGDVYVAGYTSGDWGALSWGDDDIFLGRYEIDSCYADCDQTTGVGLLDIFDLLCFQNSFINSEPYACDCDTTTGVGVCDVFDFLCFQDRFVGGCP